jgi:alpha-D-xyloside xylohydrolase
MDALKSLPGLTFPLPGDEIEASLMKGKVALRFPLDPDEEIYGLGVDFKTMSRTGSTFQLHVDHWSGRSGRTHAPVPLYISSQGLAFCSMRRDT